MQVWRIGGNQSKSQHGPRRFVEELESRTLLNAAALDTTFANSGKLDTSGAISRVHAIVMEGSRIVVGGAANATSFGVARYNSNGSLDTTFGNAGVAKFDFGPSHNAPQGVIYTADVIAIGYQGDGKIIAFGSTTGGEFGVVRFTADGALDTTFGNGGAAIVDFQPAPSTTVASNPGAMVIAPDDSIYLAGSLYYFTGNVVVAHLTSSGVLDSNFDGDGTAMTPIRRTTQYTFQDSTQITVNTAILQSDGKLLVGSRTHVNDVRVSDMGMVNRLTTAGAMDTTFAGSGISMGLGASVKAMQMQPFNGILVASDDDQSDIVFSRLTSTGLRDNSYKPNSYSVEVAYANLPAGSVLDAVQFLPDGRILYAGKATGQTGTDLLIGRLNSDITTDVTFNKNLAVLTDLGRTDDEAFALAVQPDGKYLAAGLGLSGAGAVVRYAGTDATGIWGTVFDDSPDRFLPGRANQTVYLDTNNNGTFDAGEPATLSNSVGVSSFEGLAAGTYMVRIVTPTNFIQDFPADGAGQLVQLAAGQQATGINFGQSSGYPVGSLSGSISGSVFYDSDQDGIHDLSESGISGRTVFFDLNDNGEPDYNERSTATDSGGNYMFTQVPAGTYPVREVLPAGWHQTLPAHTTSVVLGDHQNITGVEFGSVQLYSIAGYVFDDANGNGVADAGEAPVAGRTVYLDSNNNGVLDSGEPSFVTTGTTPWDFDFKVQAGDYALREVVPAGYAESTRDMFEPTSGSTFPTDNVVHIPGDTVVPFKQGFIFGTKPVVGGSITGTVYNDANGSRTQDIGEAGVAGITVYNDANNNVKLDAGELTTVTDANGGYTFAGLSSGSYKIRQILQSGWTQTTPANNYGWTITLATNQQLTGKDFGTRQTPVSTGGSISGTVYNDANANAKRDSGEAGVAGITIYNDANNNSKLDSGELTTITDANGAYALSGLSAGSYKIREILQSGWSQTTPTNNYGWTITLASNQQLTGKDFGTKQSGVTPPPPTGGSISGTVFNDLDGDGVKDSNEVGVGNITIYNDANNNSKLDNGELTTTTDSNGAYTLANLAAGSYKIREILQSGWLQTTPAKNYGWTITLGSNQQLIGKNFGTKQSTVTPAGTASISGFTFNDNNKNGAFDGGDVKTSGKTVFLDTNNNGKLDSGEKSVVSDANGNWSFNGLSAGTYHVRRVFPSGYTYSTTLIDLTLNAGDNDSGLLIGSEPIA